MEYSLIRKIGNECELDCILITLNSMQNYGYNFSSIRFMSSNC